MMKRNPRLLFAQGAAAIALTLAGTAALAADAATDAIAVAYEPYRAALFRTNGKAQAESEAAMTAARAAWRTVQQRFAAVTPAPYDRDNRFAATLAEVDKVYGQAEAEIRQSRLADAHETLEKVRDLLGEMRRRNGVITYSDHINAYHEQMEQVVKHAAGWLAATPGLTELALQAGALEHLAKNLASEADAARRADPAFANALREVQAAVSSLRAALLAQDAAAARAATAAAAKAW
jgi:hypothetical protein